MPYELGYEGAHPLLLLPLLGESVKEEVMRLRMDVHERELGCLHLTGKGGSVADRATFAAIPCPGEDLSKATRRIMYIRRQLENA